MTVKATLTADRRDEGGRGTVENREFAAFSRRIIRAHAKRVAAADPTALRDLIALQAALDTAVADAVAGLKAAGYSWAEIARETGTTRQACAQRWGQAS